MKEAEKQRKGVRHSLFKRFLMIVVILLLCMIGSFLAVDYTVRKMAESSTLSSNEKILQQIDAKTKEFHNSIYNMLTLLAYEQTTYQYFTQSQRERLGSYEDLQILLSNMMMIQNDIARRPVRPSPETVQNNGCWSVSVHKGYIPEKSLP